MKKTIQYILLLGVCIVPAMAWAAGDPLSNLDNISLENLGNVVTSVSKRPEDSFRSAAAIYVITNEDIKLSGATHIAEVLRGVPGLDVARVDGSNWSITSRGFNSLFSNKLLVLIDGRTIYTPLFAGVYWDIQNLPLEDVDRVEVIRGPGAALWGSNAVNGVINIITKSAADTQGSYVSQVVGTEDRSLTDVRYGGKVNDNLYYRVYAKNDDRLATHTVTGENGNNAWDSGKAGFRADWDVSSSRKITFQGDVYDATINLDLAIPDVTTISGVNAFDDQIHSHGANILGKWEEKHSSDLQSTFQAYIDMQSPNYSSFQQDIYTLDFDYQTAWKVSTHHDITWGAGMRYIAANLEGSTTIFTADNHVDQEIYSAFLQDQIALIQNELYLTLGSKFEENSFVGFVPEPSARISWSPDNKQTVWGAVSHAVRTPAIYDRELSINLVADSGAMLQQQFSHNFESEELTAYEVGYRIKPIQKVSIDSTAYLNEYNRLETLEPGDPQAGGTILPYVVSNLGSGHAYGFETSATWDVASNWNLKANYTYINMLLNQNTSQDPTFLSNADNVPHNQYMLRSQLFLPHDVQMINTGYYVEKLPASSISSYLRFDTQVIWQAMKGVEVSFVGQNLLHDEHAEAGAPADGAANEIPRAFYGRVTVRF